KKDIFRNIHGYLPEGSMLVFNNTRVIHARLFFRKESGAKIEVFCLEPVLPAEHQLSFRQTQKVVWRCMVGNAKRWKDEILSHSIKINGFETELKAMKNLHEGNTFLVEF